MNLPGSLRPKFPRILRYSTLSGTTNSTVTTVPLLTWVFSATLWLTDSAPAPSEFPLILILMPAFSAAATASAADSPTKLGTVAVLFWTLCWSVYSTMVPFCGTGWPASGICCTTVSPSPSTLKPRLELFRVVLASSIGSPVTDGVSASRFASSSSVYWRSMPR